MLVAVDVTPRVTANLAAAAATVGAGAETPAACCGAMSL